MANQLEAGAELDAMICTRVMGWPALIVGSYCGTIKTACGSGVVERWSPSTDIADAWLVVEKMRKTYCFSMHDDARDDEMIYVSFEDEKGNHWTSHRSAPLAVCRAAIAAVTPVGAEGPQNRS